MKPEAQRIAIAEFCDKLRWTYLDNTRYPDCPDYLNDLNAMREAEKMLTSLRDKVTYVEWLCHTFKIPARDTHLTLYKESIYHLVHAPASQRAEAFLKTIGKSGIYGKS